MLHAEVGRCDRGELGLQHSHFAALTMRKQSLGGHLYPGLHNLWRLPGSQGDLRQSLAPGASQHCIMVRNLQLLQMKKLCGRW